MSDAPYPLKPTDGDLDDESLLASMPDPGNPEDGGNFSIHSGYRGCQKCETVGAHQWHMVCTCCGKEQGRFEAPEYFND